MPDGSQQTRWDQTGCPVLLKARDDAHAEYIRAQEAFRRTEIALRNAKEAYKGAITAYSLSIPPVPRKPSAHTPTAEHLGHTGDPAYGRVGQSWSIGD